MCISFFCFFYVHVHVFSRSCSCPCSCIISWRIFRERGRPAWTCSVDMQHGDTDMEHGPDTKHRHAAWTCRWVYSMGMQHGQATGDMDMEHEHEAWKRSIYMWNWRAEWTCKMDVHIGRAVWTSNMDKLHWQAAWISSIDMQHGRAWTCIMNMQQGTYNTGHAVWTHSLDKQEDYAAWRHRQAAWKPAF